MVEGWASRVAAAVICVAAVCWLALGFLVGVQTDEEEYRHVIPSTMVAAEAMQRGELDFWTSHLGLGVPQPFVRSLSMHPLTPLLGRMPVVAWVKLFYALQLAMAALAMWYFARHVGASPLAAAMAVATYVLASPAVNYALRDFWPSGWPVYTLAPVVVLSMLVLCGAASRGDRLRASLGLGLAAGVLGATGHQGYLVVFVPSCVACLLPHWRSVARGWAWWLLAGVIAVLIVAPVVVQLSTELALSSSILDRSTYTGTLTAQSLWDVFARPFGPPDAESWSLTTFRRGARVLFFGGPAAVLAILFIIRVQSRRDLMLGMLIPLLPLTVPGLLPTKYLSAVFLFRDPLILFAALAAALALDWLAARGRGRRLAVAALVAQLVVLTAGAWPFIDYNLQALGRDRTTDVFAGDAPAASWLRDQVRTSPGRVYYTAGVDDRLWAGTLLYDGLWRNSMFYRGVAVINAHLNFVSIDPLSTGSRIRGQSQLTSGDTTVLDIAGARWILALDGEAVSSQFTQRAAMTSRDGTRLVLYELASARGAAFADASVRDVVLTPLQDCQDDRLLCRDFAPVRALLSPAPTRVDRSAGRVMISFTAAPQPRLLLVGEMYRPGWQVAEAGAAVEPLLGALVGVHVPAGASRVTLRYRPPARVALARTAWTTMALTAVALASAWGVRLFPRRGHRLRSGAEGV